MDTLPYKAKQFFFVLIKLGIVLFAFYFIYKKLTSNNQLDFVNFIESSTKTKMLSLKNGLLLFLLSSFNWFFEILKWQNLVSYVQKITFYEALKQSLSSLTASLFTPNRVGEYGIKAIYYSKIKRKRIMLINFISNMLQMGTTLIFGIIGFLFFINRYNPPINYFKLIILFFSISITVVLIFLWIKQNSIKIRGIPLSTVKHYIFYFPRDVLVRGGLYAIMRYGIFSFQFHFLLLLFGIDMLYLESMVVISTMYLLASIIPTISIFDAVIKGSIAVYLFSFLNLDSIIILTITSLMWILNFALPSIVGSYYVILFKLPKNDMES
ncbi:hypothetical protein [Aestuariivivens marinum]|uniref:hypothetical protein n=1 Tax=Aestuariivivens marinum TaxID=2913555 RepID=UPI001F5811E5|nr:hypothetical protein [Aestuariivivens marinum]